MIFAPVLTTAGLSLVSLVVDLIRRRQARWGIQCCAREFAITRGWREGDVEVGGDLAWYIDFSYRSVVVGGAVCRSDSGLSLLCCIQCIFYGRLGCTLLRPAHSGGTVFFFFFRLGKILLQIKRD